MDQKLITDNDKVIQLYGQMRDGIDDRVNKGIQ